MDYYTDYLKHLEAQKLSDIIKWVTYQNKDIWMNANMA